MHKLRALDSGILCACNSPGGGDLQSCGLAQCKSDICMLFARSTGSYMHAYHSPGSFLRARSSRICLMLVVFSPGISFTLGLLSLHFLLCTSSHRCLSCVFLSLVYTFFDPAPSAYKTLEIHHPPTVLTLCQYFKKWARPAELMNGSRGSSKEI